MISQKPIKPHSVLGLWMLMAIFGHGSDIQETALAVAEQSRHTLVTVRAVINVKRSIRGQSRDQEQKIETTGTIIDASGLTVASAAAVDPTSMIRAMVRASSGRTENSIEAEFKETTLILDDGTEIESDIILKDSDLDMIFIKPRQALRSFEAIELKTNYAQPQLLDPVFVVGRLGKIGNREITLHLGRLQALVKGPRPFYICNADLSVNLGCVVYNSQGDPLGILLTKQNPAAMRSSGSRLGGSNQVILPIVRTIGDLMEIADQARQTQSKL